MDELQSELQSGCRPDFTAPRASLGVSVDIPTLWTRLEDSFVYSIQFYRLKNYFFFFFFSFRNSASISFVQACVSYELTYVLESFFTVFFFFYHFHFRIDRFFFLNRSRWPTIDHHVRLKWRRTTVFRQRLHRTTSFFFFYRKHRYVQTTQKEERKRKKPKRKTPLPLSSLASKRIDLVFGFFVQRKMYPSSRGRRFLDDLRLFTSIIHSLASSSSNCTRPLPRSILSTID